MLTGNPHKPVRSGERIQLGANAFNTVMKSALLARHAEYGSSPTIPPLQGSGIVLIKNGSGSYLDRFSVLGIAGPLITRAENASEFLARVVLGGVTPTAEGHSGKFAILREPAADGGIVRAHVQGVCQARVYMNDEGHGFADVQDGESGQLASAGSGGAQLLWIEPVEDREDPQIAWALVRIGGGGAGGVSLVISRALISSKVGSQPPYRYAAVQAVMDADGVWTEVDGGTAYDPVFNVEEQGTGGQWVNPLNAGDAVFILTEAGRTDAYSCTRSRYRGTY